MRSAKIACCLHLLERCHVSCSARVGNKGHLQGDSSRVTVCNCALDAGCDCDSDLGWASDASCYSANPNKIGTLAENNWCRAGAVVQWEESMHVASTQCSGENQDILLPNNGEDRDDAAC
jgi:hypothetical protein